METLSITEVCRRTGLSARSLRFYESRGLLGSQRSAAGQRRYGAAELSRLHQITALKAAGFTLARIGELVGARGLPLDPASPAAQAFVAEWRALLAPFAHVASADMWEGANKLYDRIDEWSGEVKPPFSSAVWDFIKMAAAAGGRPHA